MSLCLSVSCRMVRNRGPAELVPVVPAIKSDMALSPASVASNGQFSFTSSEALALDSAYTSDMIRSEALPLGPNCGTYSSKESLQQFCHIPWSFSFSDLAVDLTPAEGEMQHDAFLLFYYLF